MAAMSALAGDLDSAARFVSESASRDDPSGPRAFNSVLETFTRTGNVEGAAHWLNHMTQRGFGPDAASYNLILSACAKSGDGAEAQAWFESMERAGFAPDALSYSSVIEAFGRANDRSAASVWYNRFRTSGLPPSKEPFFAMLRLCSNNGDAEGASEWLQRMSGAGFELDKFCYQLVMKPYTHRGDTKSTMQWLRRMESNNVKPDVLSFNRALFAFYVAKDANGAERLLNEMQVQGPEPNEDSFGLVMQVHAEKGDGKAFDALAEKIETNMMNLWSLPWDKMLQSLAKAGALGVVSHWLGRMQTEGPAPAVATCNALIRELLRARKPLWARRELERMGSTTTPEATTYLMFIRQSAQARERDAAADWHDRMVEAGIQPTQRTFTLVISAYARAADEAGVFKWLERMVRAGLKPDVATYTSVINVFASLGKKAAVTEWLERMLANEINPDEKTYTTVVKSCLRADDIVEAGRWLEWMQVKGMDPGVRPLLDLLLKHAWRGDMEKAKAVVSILKREGKRELPEMAYKHMIFCAAEAGDPDAAEDWLASMREAQFEPGAAELSWMAQSYAKVSDAGKTREYLEHMSRAEDRDKLRGLALIRVLEQAFSCFREAGDEQQVKKWKRWMVRRYKGSIVGASALSPGRDVADFQLPAGWLRSQSSDFPEWLVDFAETGDTEGALQAIEQRVGDGEVLDSQVYEVILQIQTMTSSAVAVIDRLEGVGVEFDAKVYLMVLRRFCQGRDALGAVGWFERMAAAGRKLSEASNQVVEVIMQTSPSRAIELFDRMVETAKKIMRVRRLRYEMIIRRLGELGYFDAAAEMTNRALAAGCVPGRRVTRVVAQCAMRKSAEVAAFWLVDSRLADETLMSEFVRQCADDGELDDVTDLITRLRLSHELTVMPYEAFIIEYAKAKNLETALLWFDKAMSARVTLDEPAYLEIIRCCVALKDVGLAQQWMERTRLAGHAVSFEAHKAMVQGYAAVDNMGSAMRQFENMVLSGHKPDEEAFSIVVTGYANVGDTKNAMKWHKQMSNLGFVLSTEGFTKLMQAHVQAEDIQSAFNLVRSMPDTIKMSRKAWLQLLQAPSMLPPEDQLLALTSDVAREMVRRGLKLHEEQIQDLVGILGGNRASKLASELGIDLATKSMTNM